ncbi:MAG TPA: hypothetical protein VGM33_18615, partial [Baekduia sp.]
MDFHDELVRADAPALPDRFFDRFVFNLHRPAGAGTDPSILFGFGVHPRKDVADGFVVVSSGGEQRNVRFSTALSETDGLGAGPLSYNVVDPMRAWRVSLAPNPTGVAFDLTWRAAAPAWHGAVNVEQDGVATAAFDHLFQPGRYEGTL